ncbi:MAG: hypothetical protein B5M54_00800 [Candidatus Aminicenantes bacterium 4484_214]|nr:MAG: hypothetical protein B5M54_00800 [Candidatus Aminicenantes bacterium 4484_214]RLE11007.1 MAG: hypothetical protein DRJ06_00135 [Candidatus Aminicenantes bacterium]HDJ22712.1 DoxX family membrane protein [Candidatus Aminicenantes bacterium]
MKISLAQQKTRIKLSWWGELFARLIIGVVLIWSGILKIIDPLNFARDILNYRLFPESWALWIAVILPGLELLIGLLLISGILRTGASFLALSLFSLFIVLIMVTMIRGVNPDCGCFGAFSHKVGASLLFQDLLLWLGALYLFLRWQKSSTN